MDSGNSGSLQSSSGGHEEYDSRAAAADSVSVFMSGGAALVSNAPPPFDPLSNYLHLQQNPNSYHHHHQTLPWPRPSMRSDTNTLLPNSSPPPFNLQPNNNFQPPPATIGISDNSGGPAVPTPPARNPKKRSRASRRAPTTVLTTDTTNFRAMVQEFTGIPAPPFNTSPAMSRLDLFGTRSTVQPPPYLRRPFAQKVQPPPLPSFLASSSSSSSSSPLMSTNSSSSNNNNNVNHYQFPIAQNSSDMFNIQNPILNSLLQSSNLKFPFASAMGASDHSGQQKVGVLDEQFGNFSGHGNHHHHASSATLSGLPNLITSDQIGLQNNHDDNNAANWTSNRVDPNGDKDDDRVNLRSLNGGNYSTSTTDFSGGKAPENAAGMAARGGEGMVESWICSSE